MQNRIEQFIESLTARNASHNTVRAYGRDLAEFLAFIGRETKPQEVTRKQIRYYLCDLNARAQLGRSSVARKFAAIKSFFRWLEQEGIITDNIAGSLEAPKRPNSMPRYPLEEEMTKLLDGDFLTSFPERDRLIMEMLYATGVRVNELIGMNLEDFRDDAILVRGKGMKERFVIFGECAQDALQAYLPVRAKVLDRIGRTTNALFFGLRGAQYVARLDVRSAARVVKAAARAKSLPARHPHAYRHAFATHLLDHGVSIVIVSKLLGHAKLSATERYTHISAGRMLRAYNQAHPHGLSQQAMATLGSSQQNSTHRT